MASLKIEWSTNGQSKSKVITDDKPLLIGRHPRCDIVLADPHVSRRHAAIFFNQRDFMLHNLSKTNPIIFNDMWQVPHGLRAAIEPGDNFELGEVKMKVNLVM